MLTNPLSDIPFFLVILTASSEVRLSCILFVISLVSHISCKAYLYVIEFLGEQSDLLSLKSLSQ